MKTTGILKKIDNVGRVVIPREIRRSMMAELGDTLELYMHNDMVCFKKHYTSEGYVNLFKGLEEELDDPNSNIANAGEVKQKVAELIELLKKNS